MKDYTVSIFRVVHRVNLLTPKHWCPHTRPQCYNQDDRNMNFHYEIVNLILITVFPNLFVAGLQEYIEAVTFHDYLMNSSLPSWTKIQADLNYTNIDVSTEYERPNTTVTEDNSENTRSAGSLKTFVSPVDYILGVADLTGELMRKCINNLGSGDMEGCYQTCTFVREIYSGFLSVSCTGFKDIARKIVTLRQSLSKMENACYMIHVRGSEIPKHMLADVISGTQDVFLEEDEGFC